MLVDVGERWARNALGYVDGQGNWTQAVATNGDAVMLRIVVEEGVGRVVWFGDGEHQLES